MKLRHFLHLILAATIAVADTSANAFTSLHIPSTLDLVNRYVADQSKPAKSSQRDYQPRPLSQADSLTLYSREQKRLSFEACADQFPEHRPLSPTIIAESMRPIPLCSNEFAVMYSGKSKTPLVVVEKLNRQRLNEAVGEKRSNQFYADPRLPKWARAELEDYRGQGVDRGHQSPAADQTNPLSMAQSFALSNMVPQDATHNRKPWNKIEQDVRKFAKRATGNVYVYTGPLFATGFTTIGKGRVWVPTHLYKLVYDEASRRAWAYVLPNTADARVQRPMDYADFVKVTGLDLLAQLPVTGSVVR